jgi:hypothetical protein
MRAKGRSPTSAIAPPASIENHTGSLGPFRNSMKLRGCQQSQITSSNELKDLRQEKERLKLLVAKFSTKSLTLKKAKIWAAEPESLRTYASGEKVLGLS